MKAILIIFEGDIEEISQEKVVTNMVTALAKTPGVSMICDSVRTSLLNDEEVTKCIVQHAVTPITAPSENELKITEELQLRSFCNDVLGTCGAQPLADQAKYKRRFISWMLRDTRAYSSEIVQSLLKPTRKQMEILREYGLENIPAYLKTVQKI